MINMFKKLSHTFTATVFLLAFVEFTVQTDLFEGHPCEVHTGEMGVCKSAENCKWLINNLYSGKMNYRDIRRCSFMDNVEIVCCADELKPTTEKSKSPCDMGFIFDFNCDSTTSPSPPIAPDLPNKFSGTKSAAACQRYAADATPYSNWNIINGLPVGQGEYPHMVALGYPIKDSNDFDFDCGGSIIGDHWVVTAAHCIKERRKPTIIRMGKLTLHTFDDYLDPIDRTIKQIIRHPDYSSIRKKNDIALIEFEESIEFNDRARPACIRTDTADVPENRELIITGWGSIEPDRTNRSEILLKANVTTIPLNQCNQTLVKYNRFGNQPALRALSSSQMCAINTIDNRDACQGDSGGPIFLNDAKTGLSTIVGIVSFGVSCGTNLPAIYTRIASYTDWIEKIVWP
ncbi:serine protease persephone-like isoform X2 [Contarinia nasturtii]|uniref:serine protease persephone-like isoform X2 n=1 Tax=Contarinia nasturtii TaxID=265458 RepID=UPI0012D3C88F|nr:serine protease persephone-like isoform X2 [Contarinia nasturtii]